MPTPNSTTRSNITRRDRRERRGATLVEMAVTLPVFAVFLAGLFELNHAYMAITTLRSATQQAARVGATGELTSAEVETKVLEILGSTFDPATVTVHVKDASVFDTNPSATVDVASLPSYETAGGDTRDLFVVRAEVAYSDISALPPMFVVDNSGGTPQPVTIGAQSVMRHE